VIVAVKVFNRALVALTVPLAIVLSFAGCYVRVTILIAIFYIRMTMVFEILARSFDSIVVALTLHFAKLLRRHIPSAVFLG
jgi:hypothetical protein